MADKIAIFDSPTSAFRLIEAAKPDSSGMLIDVHIIAPVWGSSGYYSESALRTACNNRVYPKGMHQHIDHPSREAAKNQPSRTISGESPLAAIFNEDGHYESEGWDKTPENPNGAGVYTISRVLPKFVEDIKAMAGHIGISHYVDGIAEEGVAPDGRKGMIIKELHASPLNTVDFVTVPGAEGHYRTMFGEMKVREDPNPNEEENMGNDKQESLTLTEVRTNHPEIFAEMKKTLTEELKIETRTHDQTKKLEEAATRIKTLEAEMDGMAKTAADCKAAGYVKEEMAKAKFPAAIAEVLTKSLIGQVVLGEDRLIDAPKFAVIVAEGIKAEQDRIAAILKEYGTGITGNGTATPPAAEGKLKESFEAAYIAMGKTPEQAKQLAEVAAGGR